MSLFVQYMYINVPVTVRAISVCNFFFFFFATCPIRQIELLMYSRAVRQSLLLSPVWKAQSSYTGHL